MTIRSIPCALCLLALCSAASAYPVQFIVDETSSALGADVCLTPTALTQQCDTVNSDIGGFLDIDFTGFTPATAAVLDLDLELLDDPAFALSWGFIGSVDGQIVNAHVLHADPGVPSPPAAIDANGDFDADGIATVMSGTATFTGSFLGQPVDEIIDLSTIEPTDNQASGTIIINGLDATLVFQMPFDVVQVDPDYGTATITGVATIIAHGTIPLGCTIDLNADGIINLSDITTFIDAFLAGDTTADINNDGVLNLVDVTDFIAAFQSGCP